MIAGHIKQVWNYNGKYLPFGSCFGIRCIILLPVIDLPK
jgi:hypothetical protein